MFISIIMIISPSLINLIHNIRLKVQLRSIGSTARHAQCYSYF